MKTKSPDHIRFYKWRCKNPFTSNRIRDGGSRWGRTQNLLRYVGDTTRDTEEGPEWLSQREMKCFRPSNGESPN